ncbi:hypothetical protein Tco_0977012 [Tanacetum coccineum]|uniref:Uncharacterized protein n=1 Tax=Tanacetum coccineum TaxID=301880 RepID=A0ABQ5EIX2_9ASTR
MSSLLAALMVVKLSVKNLWPHVQVVVASSPDENPFYQLSRSSRKEVQVRISVFSGTLLEEYCWNDRHGIEKTFCPVADSLDLLIYKRSRFLILCSNRDCRCRWDRDVGGIELFSVATSSMRRLEEIRIRSGSYGGVPMGFGFE